MAHCRTRFHFPQLSRACFTFFWQRCSARVVSTLLLIVSAAGLAGCGGGGGGGANDPQQKMLQVAKSLEEMGAKLTAGDSETRVKAIRLQGKKFDDTVLAKVLALDGLEQITLADTSVTAAGAARLAKLPSLRSIDIRGAAADDAALTALAALPKLESFKASGALVTDAGALELLNKKERALRVLALDNTNAGKDTVDEIFLRTSPSTSRLRELYMANTPIPKLLFNPGASAEYLTKLRLSGTNIGSVDMQALLTTEIEDLDISGTQVDDEGVTALTAMPKLVKLNLYNTPVTGASLGRFATKDQLTWLNIDRTSVTDAELPEVAKLTALTWLHLGRCDISNEGLQALKPLKNLRSLIVTRTAVSRDGAARLKRALPQCQITIGDPDEKSSQTL